MPETLGSRIRRCGGSEEAGKDGGEGQDPRGPMGAARELWVGLEASAKGMRGMRGVRTRRGWSWTRYAV